MKRILISFALGSFFLLSSCVTEDIPEPPAVLAAETRSDAEYNPIDQMLDIPVYIYLPAGAVLSTESYLKCDYSLVYIQENKDDFAKFRVYKDTNNDFYRIKNEYSHGWNASADPSLVFGLEFYEPNILSYLVSQYSPFVWEISQSNMVPQRMTISTSIDNKRYYAAVTGHEGTARFVNFNRQENVLSRWEIQPVDTYEIEGITYSFEPGDTFEPVPMYLDSQTIRNDTDEPMTHNLTLTKVVQEESHYSRTWGASVQIGLSITQSLKVPLFYSGQMDLSASVTGNFSYNQGSKSTRSETITKTFNITVGAGKTVTAKLSSVQYNADITYTIKLRGSLTGHVMYLKGKWENMTYNDSDFHIYYPDGTVRSASSGQVPALYFIPANNGDVGHIDPDDPVEEAY